jgi:hypothetical protein
MRVRAAPAEIERTRVVMAEIGLKGDQRLIITDPTGNIRRFGVQGTDIYAMLSAEQCARWHIGGNTNPVPSEVRSDLRNTVATTTQSPSRPLGTNGWSAGIAYPHDGAHMVSAMTIFEGRAGTVSLCTDWNRKRVLEELAKEWTPASEREVQLDTRDGTAARRRSLRSPRTCAMC